MRQYAYDDDDNRSNYVNPSILKEKNWWALFHGRRTWNPFSEDLISDPISDSVNFVSVSSFLWFFWPPLFVEGQKNQRKETVMLSQFRTYQLSLQFYRSCVDLKLPRHLKDQLLRAASSVALNLAEGSAKPTERDQMKFFFIAFGSLRECQAILSLSDQSSAVLLDLADHIGACLYKLTRSWKHWVYKRFIWRWARIEDKGNATQMGAQTESSAAAVPFSPLNPSIIPVVTSVNATSTR